MTTPAGIIHLTPADTLPEHTAYRDTGCDVFARCLACPLDRCRYDEPPRAAQRARLSGRNAQIIELTAAGMSARAVAERIGVAARTVERVRAGMRRQA